MKRTILTLAVTAFFIISARGQGFQNLNFESAFGAGTNFPGNPGNGVPVSVISALPDWTAYAGPNVLSDIYYVSNNFPGSATTVELEAGSLALSGNNLSVGLYSGGSISQTAVVPYNAESLQFEASLQPNNINTMSVTLGGQSLSYSAVSAGPDYTVYEANIPINLDGLEEGLTFDLQPSAGDALLDNVEFLPTSVPEPSEYALMGLGAILFALRLRKQQPNRI